MTRFFLALVLFGLGTPAALACDGYDLSISQRSGLTYNAADPVATLIDLEIRATDPDLPRRCRSVPVEIEIIGGTAARPEFTSGGQVLPVEWISNTYVRRRREIWRLRNSGRRRLVDGETLSIPFFRIQPGQFLEPGQYSQTWRITVGDVVTTFVVGTDLVPALRFEGDTTSGVQTLDLGDISTGSRATSDFFYRTNSAVSITLTSDNLGALVHERGEEFGRIPYSASISGTSVTLSRPAGDIVDIPFSSASIQSGRLEVEVPPSPHQYAGRYRDVITLSFIPY